MEKNFRQTFGLLLALYQGASLQNQRCDPGIPNCKFYPIFFRNPSGKQTFAPSLPRTQVFLHLGLLAMYMSFLDTEYIIVLFFLGQGGSGWVIGFPVCPSETQGLSGSIHCLVNIVETMQRLYKSVPFFFHMKVYFSFLSAGKSLATQHESKYIEVSAGLNHKVDELLVGILRQIRLKRQIPTSTSTSNKFQDEANHEGPKGIVGRLFRRNSRAFRSCDNLMVGWPKTGPVWTLQC